VTDRRRSQDGQPINTSLRGRILLLRKLYPNVDLYSGLAYEALGIPRAMFRVQFALARSAGWVAQWLELVKDPEQLTVRPRQLYTGMLERAYVPSIDAARAHG